MDVLSPLLLLAVEIESSWIVGIVTGSIGSVGAGLKLVWGYWQKREADKRAAWKEVVDDKDSIIKDKDERLEDLSKALSKKSDDHAETIKELMGITIEKIEGWSAKQELLLDRALNVQAEFTVEVRRLNLDHQ